MCDQKPQNCAELFIFFPTKQIQIETIHKARNYPKLHENYIQEQTSDKCTICSGCKYNSCFSLLYNAIISLYFNQFL